jgi:hypothetical protein
MAPKNTPKRERSVESWIGYPLVCLLIAGVFWRVEVETGLDKAANAPAVCPSTHQTLKEEFTGTWEEVVTAIPAMIRQLL